MDQLLHFLGLCPDHMSHPNVIAAIGSGLFSLLGLKYAWYRIKTSRISNAVKKLHKNSLYGKFKNEKVV